MFLFNFVQSGIIKFVPDGTITFCSQNVSGLFSPYSKVVAEQITFCRQNASQLYNPYSKVAVEQITFCGQNTSQLYNPYSKVAADGQIKYCRSQQP